MDYFRFTSIHYDYVPTGRERPVELWLTVESYLPSTLYVGAVLILAVEPISLVPRPDIARLFTGAARAAPVFRKLLKPIFISI